MISVVDGAQLSEETLENWRGVFYAMGTRPVVRQFECPGRYVQPEQISQRYDDLTVGTNVMYHAFGTRHWGSGLAEETVKGRIFSLLLIQQNSYPLDMVVAECSINTELPACENMTGNQKRLWNRDIIYMDALLHPERKAKMVVERGDVSQIQTIVEGRLITPDNIIEMLNIATEKEHVEATAMLLELRHQWPGELMDPFQDLSLD